MNNGSVRLTFLGGAGTVTGSKYLLETDSRRILIDCGVFQGLKHLRERNWQPLPFDPKSIDAIVHQSCSNLRRPACCSRAMWADPMIFSCERRRTRCGSIRDARLSPK